VGRYPTARHSLSSVTPQTGRRHQIRRHMKPMFHSIVGDTTHGDGRHKKLFRIHFGCRRLLLAATGLAFRHPCTGAELRVQAPLDEDYRQMLTRLGWDGRLPEHA